MPISLDCHPEMKLLCAILLLTIGLLFIPIFSVGLMPEMDLKSSLCSQIIAITSLKHVMPPPLGYIVFYSVQGLGDFTGPLSVLFSRQAGLTRLVYFHLLCGNDNTRSSNTRCSEYARYYPMCFMCINSLNSITVVTVIPILQTTKLRHREVKELAQGHIAGNDLEALQIHLHILASDFTTEGQPSLGSTSYYCYKETATSANRRKGGEDLE